MTGAEQPDEWLASQLVREDLTQDKYEELARTYDFSKEPDTTLFLNTASSRWGSEYARLFGMSQLLILEAEFGKYVLSSILERMVIRRNVKIDDIWLHYGRHRGQGLPNQPFRTALESMLATFHKSLVNAALSNQYIRHSFKGNIDRIDNSIT